MLRQTSSQHFRGPAALVLVASWVLGPVAWALHENVSYFLVPHVCAWGATWPLYLTSGVTLALAVVAGVIAWRSWAVSARRDHAHAEDWRLRVRFMALVGLLFSALSAFGILAESLPSFILDPCLYAQ